MILIEGIEIGYFRSIYKQRLDKLDGLSILFGRNDSGKSNFLRALNLFFNGQTNPNQPFSFDRDLCHARRSEVEGSPGARKFVYVKVEFQTPQTWRKSLGERFWVKKSWSVTKQSTPNIESSIRSGNKQQYLTRFLNKIRFHYVPAIKDRRIFEELLAQIYSVVATQEEFRTSLQSFSQELRDRTADLSEGILAQLTLQSVIAPPKDLADLFRSLDFETESDAGDLYSLTLQRGDGLQVRHIPAILAFLSDRRPEDYHVWGFEEPENSLELANAIAEADAFCAYGNEDNKQIFLTSHSPAFFSLDGEEVNRFFVSTEDLNARRVSKIQRIRDMGGAAPGDLMGETPHLPVISRYLTEADAKIRELERSGLELQEIIADRNQSLLFVEGRSDAVLLEAAWNRYVGRPPPFSIESAEGTSKMESLARDGRVLNRLAPNRQIYVVVDNDADGRQLLKTKRLDGGGKWYQHKANGTHWCRLPFTDDFQRAFTGLDIPVASWPGCLENLFSPDLRRRALEDGAYETSVSPHADLLTPDNYRRIASVVGNTDDPDRFYILAPGPESKISFSDWLVQQLETEPDILDPLRSVVEGLSALIDEAEQDSGHVR